MREAFSAIWQAASTLLGILMFAAVMWWAARAHSRMWRLVSRRYPERSAASLATKMPETIVVVKRTAGRLKTGDYRRYSGAVVAVHENGLTLSLVPPFNLLCPPMTIPFEEMELQSTVWALWPDPVALRLRRLADVDIILGRDTVQWIRRQTDQSPFGLGV